ncbi:ABC transporter ATP-binding protein [Rhodoligotrophos defluvii]|uniref:ABC transporter ATP-binding protein n=1 Tax=Rhodoligotrophos defluvii TaxID=2561934 RepID=UPI0010C9D4A2|nr:ABC transporter ATP-binding protein [Rhodoligotrophos defluvii]
MNTHVSVREGRIPESNERTGAVVEFKGVTKTYGAMCVLQPTSLTIDAGEFFAIIGPSGSGKSTLLGITAGFVTPTEGSILVDGVDVVSIPPYHRNFGMVFQNYSLFPHMTVAENIGFPLRMRHCPKADIAEKVARALSMVRLEGLGDRKPAQLSGGQQQRVALARAAVYNPRLLLMDEPLGALDKNLREEMQEEIKRFQQNLGVTVIYVTHDQHEAAYMADRIAIMRSGTLEQIGSPRELYEEPKTIFVASFLGEATLLPVTALRKVADGQIAAEIKGDLTVQATAVPGTATGKALCIRPESIALGSAAAGLDNSFEGIVEDTVYTTGSVRYRIRLADTAHVMTARIPSRPDIALMQPGDRVQIGWGRRDALLIGED